jgi:hypothetical protein
LNEKRRRENMPRFIHVHLPVHEHYIGGIGFINKEDSTRKEGAALRAYPDFETTRRPAEVCAAPFHFSPQSKAR